MANETEKKLTKEERDRLHRAKKKKIQKQKKKEEKSLVDESSTATSQAGEDSNRETSSEHVDESEIEYIYENQESVLTGQYYEIFKDVFQKYQEKQILAANGDIEQEEAAAAKNAEDKKKEEEEQEEKKAKRAQEKIDREQNKEKLSRKQRKQQRWLQVAQLKAMVKRPDLVEAWDITAPDPSTLVFLKSLKNTVPVPRHWSQKRKYLQNKRGVLKQAFRLPEHIENTGIARLRDPFSERDGSVMVKQKLRDRMNPKMGKIEIDYDVLHEAFFKYQTKPKLSIHGDVYYEGKEDECGQKKYKPGRISSALREALEISDFTPPPWLASMQRYGPPPSYPNLRIIGMTYHEQGGSNFINRAAIEDQVKQGHAPGVYGTFRQDEDQTEDLLPVSKGYWGQVIEDDDNNGNEHPGDEPEEEELEEEDGGDDDVDFEEQLQQYDKQQGGQGSASEPKHGTVSSVSGYETPEVDLRNQTTSAPLYHVLEQVQNKNLPGQLMGTQHTYSIH